MSVTRLCSANKYLCFETGEPGKDCLLCGELGEGGVESIEREDTDKAQCAAAW